MKLISKISIHPLFYIVLFITFITGYLKVFLGYTLIIIVHELGHIFALGTKYSETMDIFLLLLY